MMGGNDDYKISVNEDLSAETLRNFIHLFSGFKTFIGQSHRTIKISTFVTRNET